MLRKILSPFSIFLIFALSSCDFNNIRSPIPVVYNGLTMGTYYKITLLPNNHKGTFVFDDSLDQHLFHDLIKSELKDINNIASTYLPGSEISVFNNLKSNNCIEASKEFLFLISESIRINQYTNGFYNPLVGPLVNLWGFGPNKSNIPSLPSDKDIKNIKNLTNLNNIQINEEAKIICKSDDIYLDLSGLAKGYAVDKLASLLKSIGAKNFLVDIGGEIYSFGKNKNNEPWQLAIEDPSKYTSKIKEIVSVSEGAIATSGNYRNFFEIDDVVYSHIINPMTGYPTVFSLSSVSVIDKSTYVADALATAIMAMGFDAAKNFAIKNDLAVYLIDNKVNFLEDEEATIWYSENFKKFLN